MKDNVESKLVQACGAEEPRETLLTVYQEYYLAAQMTKFEERVRLIQVLTPIVDKYCNKKLDDILPHLFLDRWKINACSEDSFEEVVLRWLIGAIVSTPKAQFTCLSE